MYGIPKRVVKSDEKYEVGTNCVIDVDAKCEYCGKQIKAGDEVHVSSFGGYANPVYGFTCSRCNERGQAAFEAAEIDAEIHQDNIHGDY